MERFEIDRVKQQILGAESSLRGYDIVKDRAKHLSDSSSNGRSEEEIERARKEAVNHGKHKMEVYKNEATLWQHTDRDTFELFKDKFETDDPDSDEELDGLLMIESKSCDGKDQFWNGISINKGLIKGWSNHKWQPLDWNLSEIIYNQLLLILTHVGKDISQFNITGYTGMSVTDPNINSVVKLFMSKEEEIKTFNEGDEGFIALAGTRAAQSKFYMLAQHQKAFQGKKVKSITVNQYPDYADNAIEVHYEIA